MISYSDFVKLAAGGAAAGANEPNPGSHAADQPPRNPGRQQGIGETTQSPGAWRASSIISKMPAKEADKVMNQLAEYRHRAGTDDPRYLTNKLISGSTYPLQYQRPEVLEEVGKIYNRHPLRGLQTPFISR